MMHGVLEEDGVIRIRDTDGTVVREIPGPRDFSEAEIARVFADLGHPVAWSPSDEGKRLRK